MYPLAQSSGLSFLIYLIVGAFWLIGNLLQSKQAKKKALEMRKKRLEHEEEERRTGKKVQTKQNTIERELETFLGRFASETPQPAPPPMPKAKAREPEVRFDPPTPKPPTVVNPPKEAASKSYNIGELDMEASFKQISEMKEAVEMIGEGLQNGLQEEALKNVRSMMVDLSSSSISVPSVQLQSIRAIRTKTDYPDLRNKKQFRKALAASVILGPPKALQEKPFIETP